jgi:phosphonate transport system substrate-binding protein
VRHVFRLGISPARDPSTTREAALALVDALAELLRREVELHWAPDYRSLVATLSTGGAQLAWLPPLAAAEAVDRRAVRPVAVAVRGGRSTYGSALFARAGSPIRTTSDLCGVRAAWVDVQSAGGYAAIRASLRGRGVRLVDAFGDETFLRSYVAVAAAVLDGRADVGATFLERVGEGVLDAGWRTVATDDAFQVVAECASIPSDFFGVHADVTDADLALLGGAFVDARPARPHRLAKELSGADRFCRPTAAWSAGLHDLLDESIPSSGLRAKHPASSEDQAPLSQLGPPRRSRR